MMAKLGRVRCQRDERKGGILSTGSWSKNCRTHDCLKSDRMSSKGSVFYLEQAMSYCCLNC